MGDAIKFMPPKVLRKPFPVTDREGKAGNITHWMPLTVAYRFEGGASHSSVSTVLDELAIDDCLVKLTRGRGQNYLQDYIHMSISDAAITTILHHVSHDLGKELLPMNATTDSELPGVEDAKWYSIPNNKKGDPVSARMVLVSDNGEMDIDLSNPLQNADHYAKSVPGIYRATGFFHVSVSVTLPKSVTLTSKTMWKLSLKLGTLRLFELIEDAIVVKSDDIV